MAKNVNMFKTFADNSISPIFIIQDDNFIYTNQAMQEMTGYSEAELLSMNFWDLVHPDMKEMVKERGYSRLKGEKPVQYLFQLKGNLEQYKQQYLFYVQVLLMG